MPRNNRSCRIQQSDETIEIRKTRKELSMKLTCQNRTPEIYPDNCITVCPVSDTCTINSMAQGGV